MTDLFWYRVAKLEYTELSFSRHHASSKRLIFITDKKYGLTPQSAAVALI
jgi:hypothetical protein